MIIAVLCRPSMNLMRLRYDGWRFGSVGNVIGRINEVDQRRARLVLGWVTVCRRVNHLGMQPTTQVSSAWPSFRGQAQ